MDLPPHLVRLPNEDWALWKTVCLRSAGFPISLSSIVTSSRAAAAADELLSIECEADGMDVGQAWSRSARLGTAREKYLKVFGHEVEEITGRLCAVAESGRFREAVTWQNRRAVHTALIPLLDARRAGDVRNKKQRDRERLVARYIQRFSLKNDTIGFFGPVGWACISPESSGIVVRVGAELLARRQVYFESWTIDVLAAQLSKMSVLQPWLVPALTPTCRIESGRLVSGGRPVFVSAQDLRLLEQCDGAKRVKEFEAFGEVGPSGESRESTNQSVLVRLQHFRAKGWITLEFQLPLTLAPEESLRHLLSNIEDVGAKQMALGMLSDLEDARRLVAAAAGDADRLDVSLADLEATFTRTAAPDSRSQSGPYVRRALVYEDCCRDVDVSIGGEVLDALGPPLALLLCSARWLTYESLRRSTERFHAIYDELLGQTATQGVELEQFLKRAMPVVLGRSGWPLSDVRTEFRRRWSDVLNLPGESAKVTYSTDQLRQRVETEFAAPGAGWQCGRYHSPDIMIAAASLADVVRGNFECVLGEMHVASNTIGPLFLAQHPDEASMRRALDTDLSTPRLEPLVPKLFRLGQSARMSTTLVSPKDVRLRMSADVVGPASSNVLSTAELWVRREGQRLLACTRDGCQRFDVPSLMAQIQGWALINQFDMIDIGHHRPRVSFDKLVVLREAWTFVAAELEFAFESEESQRFLEARRWARSHSLPREVFVRTPDQTKPFHIAFDSPPAVNILSVAARRAATGQARGATLSFTEMLPTSDQAWLADAEGGRYTSELRMVALDLRQAVR